MAKTLAQIFDEAEAVIEKRASASAPAPSVDDDEIYKLAAQVRCVGQRPPTASDGESSTKTAQPFEYTETEKVAYALAFVETVLSGKELAALSELEKTASEKGVSDEDLQEFFNKVASKTKAGQKVQEFLTGLGTGFDELVHGTKRVLKSKSGTKAQKAGRITPYILPSVGTLGLGAAVGSASKEHEIKSQLGIR